MKSFTQLEGMSLNVAITIASGAGFLLFGYDQGFFGGICVFEDRLSLILRIC